MEKSSSDETAASLFLSPQQFSKEVGWGIATVRRLIKSGKLPIYQPGGPGTRVAIPRAELESLHRRCDALASPNNAPPEAQKSSTKRRSGPAPKWMQDDG